MGLFGCVCRYPKLSASKSHIISILHWCISVRLLRLVAKVR